MKRCTDCGGDFARLKKCSCGAESCWECIVAYHSQQPRLGCATQTGKRIAEDIQKRLKRPLTDDDRK